MSRTIERLGALLGAAREEVSDGIEVLSGGIDARLRSRYLFQYERVRKLVDFHTRGIAAGPMPELLMNEQGRGIIVSNYPSDLDPSILALPRHEPEVGETVRAVLKVGCRLPGKKPRLRAIGRDTVVTDAGFLFKAIGADQIIYQAEKDSGGIYRLKGTNAFAEIIRYLKEPGHVLWSSSTGNPRGNGLVDEDLRTGPVGLALAAQVPVVPMGIVTEQRGGEWKAVEIRFGEPVSFSMPPGLGRFERDDFRTDCLRVIMCHIAENLSEGHRGSFENPEEKLETALTRLREYGAATGE